MKKSDLFSFLEIFSQGRALEKRLLRNHLLAVLLLITMVSISFLILTSIIKTQHNNSSLINKSGKQRMYTQRVLYYYSKYVSFQTQNSKIQIYENLEKLHLNNRYLSSKLNDRDSISFYDKSLLKIINGKDGVIEKLKLFRHQIDTSLETQDYAAYKTIEQEGEVLISLYDKATLQYQKLAEDKVAQFLIFETSLYVISLLTIFLEALLIFRPAIMEVFNKHTQLRSLNKNLSSQVKKKVTELREKEQLLIQQSKLAEMGEMLSNISHQWKQPLTILSMQIEDLELSLEQKKLNNEEYDVIIENCYKQIDLMSNTIEDFKRFYMPDNEKRVFSIHALIENIVQMEKSALNNNTIQHVIKCKDKSLMINGYEGQLQQVLLSLTNNAIEQLSSNNDNTSTSKKLAKIEYAIKQFNEKVIITVKDNAGGIPQKFLKKIFKPYFSTKKDHGGSGIGLYMAKNIINKNFLGKLYVKNKRGGAKFYIELQLDRSL